MNNYRFGGHVVRSAFSLPELARARDSAAPWCTVADPSARATCDSAADELAPHGSSPAPAVRLDYGDRATFMVRSEPCEIDVEHSPQVIPAELRHLLLNHVLPRVLDSHGIPTLHASGVRFGSGCALFLGQSGDGKSSLAASMSAEYEVLGDDCFVLRFEPGRLTAQSSYRSLRLHADSVRRLVPSFNDPDPDHGPKTDVVDSDHAPDPGPHDVRALFVLDTSPDGNHPVRVQPMSVRDGAVHLVRNSFRMDVSGGPALTDAFDRAEQAIALCPVYRLSYPHDYDVLPHVHDAIRSVLES